MKESKDNKVTIRIYRGEEGKQYWEEFLVERKPSLNVISALMVIQENPVNAKGEKVEPVVWEQACLEEVCGSCSMLVNGKPRQACTAIIEKIIESTDSTTISLAPFSKFPVVRDLVVNRGEMFDNLKKVGAWVDADGTFIRGPGPKTSQKKQEVMYTLSTCMTCGCCSEACPQVNNRSDFMGPAPISQVRLFNADGIGKESKTKRLHALMQEDGIGECGNSQNCVQVCPKEIPLTESIASIGRDVSVQMLKDMFSSDDKEDE